MSFDFLPWPLYVLMISIANIVCFFWIIETWQEHPKAFIMGFVFAGIGSIMAGICRVIEETGFGRSYLDFFSDLTIFSVLGVVLLFGGGYIKANDDPDRKKLVLKIACITGIGLTLCGFALAYIKLQEAGLLW